MDSYQHILLAVDCSPDSETIGRRAVALAEQWGARITLIHVVEHVPLDLSNDLMVAQPLDIDAELMADARRRLAELAQLLGLADAKQEVVMGSTKAEILRTAEQLQVDLMVVGSHGRHGLALLLGSTANAVLHGARCDLLAVRVLDETSD